MKMFGNLTSEGLEEVTDVVGGGGLVDTGIYAGTIKLAYAGKSQNSDAQSVTVHIEVNGLEVRETLWVTNKKGENFYVDKKDKDKRHELPGYTAIDQLCLLATNAPLAEQEFKEKVVELYNFEERKNVPTEVPVLTALIDKPIKAAIVRQIVDKTAKDSNGVYQPTGETREENIFEKFLHSDNRSVTEIKNGVDEAKWAPKWLEKNDGQTRNRAKGAEGKSGAPGGAGAGAAASSPKPATSLFGS